LMYVVAALVFVYVAIVSIFAFSKPHKD